MSSTQTDEPLVVLLQRARDVLAAPLRERLAVFGLTEQQWRVISVAHDNIGINAQDLASKSAILGPSLSRILYKLQSDGILSRKAAESDLRELTIRLTPTGRRLYGKVSPQVKTHLTEVNSRIGEKKVKQLSELLRYVAAFK